MWFLRGNVKKSLCVCLFGLGVTFLSIASSSDEELGITSQRVSSLTPTLSNSSDSSDLSGRVSTTSEEKPIKSKSFFHVDSEKRAYTGAEDLRNIPLSSPNTQLVKNGFVFRLRTAVQVGPCAKK